MFYLKWSPVKLINTFDSEPGTQSHELKGGFIYY